ncbi:T9SS type A sorting domain-containing protein [Flavobacterium sp. UMI-01]|uniref:T9SS type A sorting domain-containing protein n=1 Tax=Flavobacterium sp. UMI-01 TaxID=1441053 RepID=UPI001C7D7364|nr:T9SS type A sorting domain-containing protein [Flavobacterium sp. UMI-01]GIZ10181.1 hypothetical protein FUMI01_29070 [Flavobacterium sp. UMI-01]
MKTKLLSLLFLLVFSTITYSQTEGTDYASGMDDPTIMVANGTDLYVMGATNIYKIDTTSPTPTPVSIYNTAADHYLVNICINGNTMYMAQENYQVSTDSFLGGRIFSLNLSNLLAPASLIFTSPEYISSLTNNGSIIYFTSETLTNPPSFEPFTTHVDKIDASTPSPIAETIIANLNTDSVARDIQFYNNQLFISSADDSVIFNIDVTQGTPTAQTLLSGLSFNRGIFLHNNVLYFAGGHLINKFPLDSSLSSPIAVAKNTTYQDSNNGSPFNANFRDVAIIGNTIYMTLSNQGKVLKVVDTSLGTDEFASNFNDITIYNTKNKLYASGFEDTVNTTIYNLSGQKLISKKLSPNNNLIDISTLSKGVYLFNIENQKTVKFIKI